MTYSEKFELVRKSLISYCKQSIIEYWEKCFDMWLSEEADMVFGNGYKNKFKEQFSQYMNSEVDGILWLAGKNIVFAISAFMSYKDNLDLDDVLNFTENFVSEQLDDFNNWCDHISQTMYEETSEYEREFGDKKENT